MKKITLLATLLAGNVFAGSMGPIESTYDFGGLYGGLGAGVISVYSAEQFATTRTRTASDVSRVTDTLVMFSGDVGYGRMIRQNTYLGIKGSIYYAPQETSTNNSFATPSSSTVTLGNNTFNSIYRPIYNIDAVIGYEFIPHLMPFFEAGVTFANINRSFLSKRTRTDLTTNSSVTYKYIINMDDYETSYNVGVGLNYQPHKNVILSTEFVYADLGSNNGAASAPIPGTSLTEYQTRKLNSNALAILATVSYLIPA
ncbi:MAG: outer membrane beta-barrel protein [Gammaproteobacteria bacterium]|nr:outer membrane beta-barrel protein [Gammaproteobacteria bacterium]